MILAKHDFAYLVNLAEFGRLNALLNSIKITSADLREILSVQILYQMLYKN